MAKKINNKNFQQKNKNTKKPIKQVRKTNKQKTNNAPKMAAVKKVKINSIPCQIKETKKPKSTNKKYAYIAIAAVLIVLAFIFI